LSAEDLRIALVVNNAFDIWVWRRPLVQALRRAGAEVHIIAPPGPWASSLEELGCSWIPYPLERRGVHPLREWRSLISLYRIYRRLRPSIAHHFTIKPNLYGTLAARMAGVPIVIATVSGLGYIWADSSLPARFLRGTVGLLYRLALRGADVVIYFNPDDPKVLGGRRLCLLPGEGVDLSEFSPDAVSPERRAALRAALGLSEGAFVVLMVGRMLWHKGVVEFVEAARRVRRRHPEAIFMLVGPFDEGNPAAISVEALRAWEAEGVVRYLGARSDVRDLMALADLVVLPTYYREGLPRALMEGAAMGKPLVATDVPGCREVVLDGVNGLRVPPKDPVALAAAIETLLENPALRAEFGAASRRLAEERFSDRGVVRAILQLYGDLLAAKGLSAPRGFGEGELLRGL